MNEAEKLAKHAILVQFFLSHLAFNLFISLSLLSFSFCTALADVTFQLNIKHQDMKTLLNRVS